MERFHALMLFDTELNLNLGTKPGRWINFDTKIFNNGYEAFNAFVLSDVVEKQLLSAESMDELNQEIANMIYNYEDTEWLEENVYN